ncbi:hypothetical protein EVAR_54420_1 [Eumeta japonica]|uniref:Uncharacterized protein n=1 Tax=Eumeta variegata TaxID=151549 RepID=A0A4C1Y509_EUMVA|nr:hypothetical protein EVAR_54420_1 [Eumeta japonica]
MFTQFVATWHRILHYIEKEVRHITSLNPKICPPFRNAVERLVKNLNSKKAPDLDGISNKAIACSPWPLLDLLVTIFNVGSRNCYSSLI